MFYDWDILIHLYFVSCTILQSSGQKVITWMHFIVKSLNLIFKDMLFYKLILWTAEGQHCTSWQRTRRETSRVQTTIVYFRIQFFWPLEWSFYAALNCLRLKKVYALGLPYSAKFVWRLLELYHFFCVGGAKHMPRVGFYCLRTSLLWYWICVCRTCYSTKFFIIFFFLLLTWTILYWVLFISTLVFTI